jgi:hypothetical protein
MCSLEALERGLLEALIPQEIPINHCPTINLVVEQFGVFGGGGIIIKHTSTKDRVTQVLTLRSRGTPPVVSRTLPHFPGTKWDGTEVIRIRVLRKLRLSDPPDAVRP